MVRETPELFERIVEPYIAAFPPKRIQWYSIRHFSTHIKVTDGA